MKSAKKDLEDFGKAGVDASDKIQNAFGTLKNTIATLGIGKLIKDTMDAAGDLEQSLGGARSVFKDFSGELERSADNAASSLGLAKSEYLSFATNIGALLQGSAGYGLADSMETTTKVMQRASDVASIMGVDVSDAMRAVAGAAKGNFTMMDNLGVAMNDTALQAYAYEKGLGKLETTQKKVSVAMQMFLDKTEYAAGNYAKENDTYSGSLTTLRAELKNFMAETGTALLPVAKGALETVGAVVGAVKPLVVGVAGALGAVGDAFNALDGPQKNTLVLALGLMVAIPVLTKLHMGLAAAIKFVGSAQLSTMTLLKGGLITIGLLIAALTLLQGHNQSVADKQKDVTEGMADGAKKAADGINNIGNSAKKAKNELGKLAGFDEITKLSGSSSGALTDGLIGDDFASKVDDFSAEIEKVKEGMDFTDVFGLDLDAFTEFWGGVFSKIASGDWEGAFSDVMSGIDHLLESTFGKAYTDVRDYWKEVKEIADREGVLAAVGKVCGDIDSLLTNLLGDSWTDFSAYWQKIGGKLASGDIVGAVSDMCTGFCDTVVDALRFVDQMLGWHLADGLKKCQDFFRGVGAGLFALTHADELKEIDLNSKYSGLATDIRYAINDNLRVGMNTTDAVNAAKAQYLDPTNDEQNYYYVNYIENNTDVDGKRGSLYDYAELAYKNLSASGQLTQPMTAAENYESTSAALAHSAAPTSVIELHAEFNVGEEQLGEVVKKIDNQGRIETNANY